MFRFGLDPALAQRERIERERAIEHARALRIERDAVHARETLTRRREAARRRLLHDAASVAGDALRLASAHCEYLDRAIAETERRIEAAVAPLEAARLRLVEAARDRSIVEALRARRLAAYLAQAAQAEQREFDEQNVCLAGRVGETEPPMVERDVRRTEPP
ncbi:MAG: flagellar FliJ family protein [Candidatus Eremiobacteraeota bacterium]|nr:flagellar FliJ family protein [Candidatus Eremiobacteraeota bacterium]